MAFWRDYLVYKHIVGLGIPLMVVVWSMVVHARLISATAMASR